MGKTRRGGYGNRCGCFLSYHNHVYHVLQLLGNIPLPYLMVFSLLVTVNSTTVFYHNALFLKNTTA
jgi:hypothetical protein